MRRIGIVLAVVAGLLLVDGIIQQAIGYHPQDSNQVLNTSINVSDGTTVIVSGLVLAALAAVVWWLGSREARRRLAVGSPSAETNRARPDTSR